MADPFRMRYTIKGDPKQLVKKAKVLGETWCKNGR